jgi:hypothetical protein
MYYYTNKSTEIRDQSEIKKTTELNTVSLQYEKQYTEVNNNIFENTQDYKSIDTELKYWKKASAASLEERTEIRNKVDRLQSVLIERRTTFEANKTKELNRINSLISSEKNIVEAKYNNSMNKTKSVNFITYIFLALIIITEFSTIALNKNIVEKRQAVNNFVSSKFAQKYVTASNLLTALYMSSKNGWVNILNAKYSLVNKDNQIEWEEIKEIYNNFISLNILSEGDVRNIDDKKILYNELLLSETEAQLKLDEYFERFFKVA